MSIALEFLELTKSQFKTMKELTEKAIVQIKDEEKLYWLPDGESNSIAIIIKHLAGNMRSRWTNIFTEDGEKADRNRPQEFDREFKPSRIELMALWEKGWSYLFSALDSITLEHFENQKKIFIRKQPHSIMNAILRQFHHYSLHIGQILFISKHIEWKTWETLTIPRDQEIFDFKKL